MKSIIIEGVSIGYQAYNIMGGLFRGAWSANRVQGYMSSIGMGLRRSTVQKVRRRVLGVMKKERYIRPLAEEDRPSKGMLVEMDWVKPKRYGASGTWTLFNAETGEVEEHFWSVYSDNLPTKGTIRAHLFEQKLLGDTKENYTIIDIQIKQFRHKQGAPY